MTISRLRVARCSQAHPARLVHLDSDRILSYDLLFVGRAEFPIGNLAFLHSQTEPNHRDHTHSRTQIDGTFENLLDPCCATSLETLDATVRVL
ncbi:MAG: hypothetical protein Ct9H300mP14_01440 [Gammaproteobacteria bacterium]|nr:MAG: hypothetical protein Ct9H300mP14_01440 [Gammaproteobacteria bacterium]